jgi:hypothetical protein
MSDQSTAEMVAAYLTQEGWSPRIDEDGDVVFNHEGTPHLVRLEHNDRTFFRLMVPICLLGEPENRAIAASIASEVVSEVKVAKIVLMGDAIWADIELFCDPIDRFRSVFHRSHRAAQSAVRKFRKRWEESQAE